MARSRQWKLGRVSVLVDDVKKYEAASLKGEGRNVPVDEAAILVLCHCLTRNAACLHGSLMAIEDRLEDIATTLATGLGKGSPLVRPLWKLAKDEEP